MFFPQGVVTYFPPQEGGVDRAALSKLVVGEANAERLKQLEVENRPRKPPVFHHVWEATCWWVLNTSCPGDDDASCKND